MGQTVSANLAHEAPARSTRAMVTFYNARYSAGYMQDWPSEKKQRIISIVRELNLPRNGTALDFGCGSGVLTEILRQAMPPGWRIYGTDVSTKALAMAIDRYPQCKFFSFAQRRNLSGKFDFIFSHHVLEHVNHLEHSCRQINSLLKDRATMLHILPCGNPGSFEHRLCSLRADGIDTTRNGRFFFEDSGHLRRLTTGQLARQFTEHGFTLEGEYYANQYHGAINWITQSRPGFICKLTDPARAKDGAEKYKLQTMRAYLLSIWAMRYPAVLAARMQSQNCNWRYRYAIFAACACLFPISKPIDSYMGFRSQLEWERHRHCGTGSEMYLWLRR
jgi:SAM-dependent methyltransferase